MSTETEKETPPEAASSKTSKPSVSEGRSRMKRAWFILGTCLLLDLISYVWIEWEAAHGGVEPSKNELIMLSIFAIIIVSLINIIKMLFKRALAAALIYACILIIPIIWARVLLFNAEMNIKAHLFSAYPELCPCQPRAGQRTYICYKYSDNDGIAGFYELLIVNPGDEMSLPPSQWPEEVKQAFALDFPFEKQPIPDDDCRFRKTKNMGNHIYWVSDDCLFRR